LNSKNIKANLKEIEKLEGEGGNLEYITFIIILLYTANDLSLIFHPFNKYQSIPSLERKSCMDFKFLGFSQSNTSNFHTSGQYKSGIKTGNSYIDNDNIV
jgi:hypothetical protein